MSTKVAPTQKPKKEGLRDNERLALSMGIGLAILFALGLGAMMIALHQNGPAADPDAQSLVIAPDRPRHLAGFTLTDQSGHEITRTDLNGKILVVSFLFTGCSVVCPYVNAQMEKIQQLTVNEPEVKLLSLTLDPADDTAPVLAKYGQTFEQNINRWSFLTGDESEMRNLIGKSFLDPDTTSQFASMPGNFANAQRIVLVDAKGDIVEYFDGLNDGAAEAVVAAIGKLKGAP